MLALTSFGLEAATGADRDDVPDAVFVRGRQAAALCGAYEIALALGFDRAPQGLVGARFGVGGSAPVTPFDRDVRIAVPGGRTATAMFDLLCGPPFATKAQWSRLRLYFVDERAVPPGDPESNFRLAREHLLEPIGIPADHVHRMRGEAADLDQAAREYEAQLEHRLDLVVLGIGEDGHIASLFPGSPLLEERTRRVAAVTDSPKPPPRRLTLTPRVLAEARRVLVVSEGRDKSAVAMRALEGADAPRDVPARLVRDARWIVSG